MMSMQKHEAAQIIGLDLEKICSESLTRAYKTASKRAHPDLGGSVEAQQRVVAAYEALKKEAAYRDMRQSFSQSREQEARAKARLESDLIMAMDATDWTKFCGWIDGAKAGRTGRRVTITGGGWIITILFHVSSEISARVVATYQGQKVKIHTRDYAFAVKLPLDPAIILPQKSVPKKLRALKKEDFEAALLHMGAECDGYKGDKWSIFLAPKIYLALNRSTFRRIGYWDIEGVRVLNAWHGIGEGAMESEKLLALIVNFCGDFDVKKIAEQALALKLAILGLRKG